MKCQKRLSTQPKKNKYKMIEKRKKNVDGNSSRLDAITSPSCREYFRLIFLFERNEHFDMVREMQIK